MRRSAGGALRRMDPSQRSSCASARIPYFGAHGLPGGEYVFWDFGALVCSDATSHCAGGVDPRAQEEPACDNGDACQRYPHDDQGYGHIGVTGKDLSEACQVRLTGGFNGKDLRAIVQCCAYHQKDGCHAVRRHIIVHAARELHGQRNQQAECGQRPRNRQRGIGDDGSVRRRSSSARR